MIELFLEFHEVFLAKRDRAAGDRPQLDCEGVLVHAHARDDAALARDRADRQVSPESAQDASPGDRQLRPGRPQRCVEIIDAAPKPDAREFGADPRPAAVDDVARVAVAGGGEHLLPSRGVPRDLHDDVLSQRVDVGGDEVDLEIRHQVGPRSRHAGTGDPVPDHLDERFMVRRAGQSGARQARSLSPLAEHAVAPAAVSLVEHLAARETGFRDLGLILGRGRARRRRDRACHKQAGRERETAKTRTGASHDPPPPRASLHVVNQRSRPTGRHGTSASASRTQRVSHSTFLDMRSRWRRGDLTPCG